MNKWELARYIIDGKKSVDTVLFLVENGSKVSDRKSMMRSKSFMLASVL